MKEVNLLKDNGVDIEKSLELFGDMETYDETLKDFIASLDEKLAKITLYKENTDMPNYAIMVHSLKSDSKYFGFNALADLAYQHEMESKANNYLFVCDNFDLLMNEAHKIGNLVREYLGMDFEKEVQKVAVVDKEKDTILVVDDSDIIRVFVKKVFNDEYNVIMANDGHEAINVLQSNISNLKCMLLDLNMPNCNGFEVLNFMRTNNLFTKVPVSIITGEDNSEWLSKANMYPVVDVLIKPFNERDIKNVLEKTMMYNI